MKKMFVILTVFLIVLLLSSCGTHEYSDELIYFQTKIVITIYDESYSDSKEYISYAKKLFEDYNNLSDRYLDYDNTYGIYYINHHPNETIKIDERLFNLIKFSKDEGKKIIDQDNKPYFNILIGKLSDIYNDIFDKYEGKAVTSEVFDKNQISSINFDFDLDQIELDNVHKTIKIPDTVSIDLGGIAKGYAVNELVKYYNDNGVKYFIDAGQSNLITNTVNPKRNGNFVIGLRHPETSDNRLRLYATINLEKNKALVTSADYQKYFIYDNEIYSSILSTSTNLPASTDIRSISILHDSSALGDIISTVSFMMGSKKAIEYLNNENISYIMYLKNGEIIYSDDIKDIINIIN
ncbi:FAD:protein FMN transferase [bacterium]|nr:FAD:protein FMN transferase [bacterium]